MRAAETFSRLTGNAGAYLKSNRAYLAVVFGYLTCVAALYLADPFAVQALRFIAFDSYQRTAPRPFDADIPVRIVDIDNDSIRRLGQWPWPRTTIAEIVTRLNEAGASAVVFDAIFPEPDRVSPEKLIEQLPQDMAALLRKQKVNLTSNDEVFASAIGKANVVLATTMTNDPTDKTMVTAKAGFATAGDDAKPFLNGFTRAIDNLPVLDMAAKGLGAINWIPDRDGVVRRVPLVFGLNEQIVPSLAAEALRVAQGASTYLLKSSNANGETAYGNATGLNHIRIGDIEAPVDPDGSLWLYFRQSEPSSFLPAWQVADGSMPAGSVEGRIVLIGTSAPGLADLRSTPLGAEIPGVEIHAQMLEHLLGGHSLSRPDYAPAVELFGILLIGMILAFALPKVQAVTAAIVGLVVLAALFGGGWSAYRYEGLLFDPIFPAGALFFQIAGTALHSYRAAEKKREEVQRMFSQYVSPRVAQHLTEHPEKVRLGGEVRELTLMFTDIRRFTTLSEGLTAHELTHLLNEVLTPLTDVVFQCGDGTLDKFMGDGMMAFWNAPLDDPEHARHACEAALAIQVTMRKLNVEWRQRAEQGGPVYRQIDISIGINTGPCCVGNLGSAQHYDYSAIGDDVNVTSRLEGLTRYYDVPAVIAEGTRRLVPDMDFLELDITRVKGRSGATRHFTMTGMLDIPAEKHDGLVNAHDRLLAAYRAGNWDEARDALAQCRACEVPALARVYRLYDGRIAEASSRPLPADWDGVFTATEK